MINKKFSDVMSLHSGVEIKHPSIKKKLSNNELRIGRILFPYSI